MPKYNLLKKKIMNFKKFDILIIICNVYLYFFRLLFSINLQKIFKKDIQCSYYIISYN